jgi:hypothetical protein
MRLLGSLIILVAVLFFGFMGYYWWREGSLERAGREMDQKLSGADETLQPLKDKLGEVGDAAQESVDRATDGDDRT